MSMSMSISASLTNEMNGNGSNSNSSQGIGMGGGGSGEALVIAPYVCEVCGKRYVHRRSLNDHSKSHSGATRCPVCQKSFSKVANMRAHYAAQHNDSNSNGSNGSGGNDNGDSGNNLNDDNQLASRIPLNSSA